MYMRIDEARRDEMSGEIDPFRFVRHGAVLDRADAANPGALNENDGLFDRIAAAPVDQGRACQRGDLRQDISCLRLGSTGRKRQTWHNKKVSESHTALPGCRHCTGPGGGDKGEEGSGRAGYQRQFTVTAPNCSVSSNLVTPATCSYSRCT